VFTVNLSQKNQSFFNEINIPCFLHSDDIIVAYNDDVLRLLGFNRDDEIKGRHIGEFLLPWTNSNEIKKNCIKKFIARTKTGKHIDVEVVTLPFCQENKDDFIFQSIIKDISHQRDWEERNLQAERLTAMGKLAGEIAHELNNPLGGILLYANLIKEDLKENSFASVNLDKIVKLATRCKIIAKGLLNFGKSSSTQFVSMDINQVIIEVFSFLENHLLFKDIDVKFFFDNNIPHFMGDKGGIEQVMLNLIINAGEALAGSGTLIIETLFEEEKKGITIKIKDTGFGISKEIKNRIFEPFFTTKQGTKGTGLGLSITLGIIQRHNGKIDVYSEPGKGTCFEIFLPLNH